MKILSIGTSRSGRKIMAFALACALLVAGVVLPFPSLMDMIARGAGNDPALGDSSQLGLSLGYSVTIEVATAAELAKISERVNEGEDFTATRVLITDEILLQELDEWIPIGTQEYPFTGMLDGDEHIIRGIDGDNPQFAKLFGYIQYATVKDLTLAVRQADDLSDVGLYLYSNMKASTIENCQIILDLYAPFRLMMRSMYGPDTSWYTGPGPYTIPASINSLLGLAKLVNEGTDDFTGKTLNLAGNVDLGPLGSLWEPVGTNDKPFKGNFDGQGHTVSNMQIDNIMLDTAGFFGTVHTATITGLFVTDADVHASNNVGILAGHVTDTNITECYTSGILNASGNGGGLIGYLTDTSSGSVATRVEWCYSTANVTGTLALGGLVGVVDGWAGVTHCFATGNVSGATLAGGLAGIVENTGGTARITLSAATGSLRGSGKIGGLVGSGTSGGTGNAAESSYTSSSVQAFSDSGTILGGNGDTRYTYTSGAIYPLGDETDIYINSGPGYSGTSYESAENYGSIMQSNLVPRPSTRMTALSGQSDQYFWDAAQSPVTLPGFTSAASLVYPTPFSTNDRPIDGYYPQLIDFNSPGAANAAINSAFQRFSEISTYVPLADMPTEMVCVPDSAGYYLADARTPLVPYTIPSTTTNGTINWTINGQSTVPLPDTSLESGVNNLTLTDRKIRIDEPPNQDYSIVLEASMSGLEGMNLKKAVSIRNADVRTDYGAMPPALRTVPGPDTDFPNEERITNLEKSVYIEFTKPILRTGGKTATDANGLTECSGSAWTPGASHPVTYTLLTDTLMKIEWTADIGYNKQFQLDIAKGLGFKDEQDIEVEFTYYFMSAINARPVIYFNPYVANAVETSPNEDAQTIRMVRSDPNYNPIEGYLEGVLVDNETIIRLKAANATLKVVNTLYGGAYPPEPGDTSLTKDNFHKYPGIYEMTYAVDDPEEPNSGMESKPVTRVYEVTDEIQDLFMVNGVFGATYLDDYQPIITLDSTAVANILRNSTLNDANANILAEIKKQLGEKHKAVFVDGHGQSFDMDIAYDFSNLTGSGDLYDDGFSGVVLYGIDGAAVTNPLYINVEPAIGLSEIATDYERYIVVEDSTFVHRDALNHFNPRFEQDGLVQSHIYASWELEGSVDTSLLNQPQMVTIYARDIYGIQGLTKSKNVVVIVVAEEEAPNYFRDFQYHYDPLFWERVEVKIRQSVPGKVVEVHLGREHALAPKVIFTALAQKEDVTLLLEMKNGLTLSIHSDDIDTSSITSPSELFNVYIEHVEDLQVNRDARGQAVQQFYVRGYYDIPAKYTFTIPLNDNMKSKARMDLYTYDMQTGNYTFISKIDSSSVKNGKLKLEMRTLDGEYVIF